MEQRRVLEGRKAIASYLGRDMKTCRKWERELGLPIHRLDDSAKAHVFAFADEIDRWKAEKLEPAKARKAGRSFGLSALSPKTRFWTLAAFILLFIVVAGFIVRQATQRTSTPGGRQAVKGVAVLPFNDLSAKKEYEYLCDGIADILINALNQIEGLRTPARTSAFYFKGTRATPQEIGRKLDAEWILEGSVQVYENRLRVVASLLTAADGYEVWTEKYDRNFADIFAVEDEIARRVVDNLKVKIAGDRGAPLVKPGTQNIVAYKLYLNGQYSLKKGFAEEKAIEYFEKALEEDPNYAQAYAGIARSFYSLGRLGFLKPTEAFPKSKAAALKALDIDSRNDDAFGTLCAIKMAYDWDFRGAENDFRKAIQDNPRSSALHSLYRGMLVALGRFEEALAEAKLAMSLDPLSPESFGHLGFVYYFWRKYDLAVEATKKALEMDPQNPWWYINLAHYYIAMGRYEDARAANQRRRELLGTISKPDDLDAWCALVYAHAGYSARAREIAANLEAYRKSDYYPCHLIALIYAALGEKDKAFSLLETAYRERSGQLYLLKVYPLADPLRDDPRFDDLLRRIGLEK